MKVNDVKKGVWRLTGFYGFPETARRRAFWALLRDLAARSSNPWCIIRDFNDLLSSEDKRGRLDHASWRIGRFQAAVHDAYLIDLSLERYPQGSKSRSRFRSRCGFCNHGYCGCCDVDCGR